MKRRRKNVVGNSFEQLEEKRLLAADVVMGDLNNDGSVNFQDFTVLSGHFGKTDAGWEHGDCSGNRIVGFEDFLMMAGNFGFSRGERPDGGGRPDGVEGGPGQRPEGVGERPDGVGRPDGVEGGPGLRPEGVGRPDGVTGRPGGRFQGGRPDNVEGGANREARVQATIDRLRAAVESGNLPEGATAEQVNERIAALENALATGERPEGERPENIEHPTRGGRPDGVAGRPGGRFQGGRPDNVEGGANREARVQATIDRLRAAVEGGDLPEGATAEQVNERIAALENALATGERPEGERPEGVGRPHGLQGRPNGRRPF